MRAIEKGFSSSRLFERAIALGGLVGRLPLRTLRFLPPPLNRWSAARDAPVPPASSFRSWFAQTHGEDNLATEAPTTSTRPLVRRHEARHDAAPGHVGVDVAGREGVLSSIATALGPKGPASEPSAMRDYTLTGSLDRSARRALLKERLIDYRTNVVECDEGALAATIEALLLARASTSVATPADLPPQWLDGESARIRSDEPSLSVDDLDAIDATVSGCALAIAQTGTIVLDSGARQGRRALSLVPDHLIVVILDEQIVELVPEGVARLSPDSAQTWISGPSATSDIELERIEGVHGPRTLDVVLVTPRSS